MFVTFFGIMEFLSVWIIFTVYASVPLSEQTSHVPKFKCQRCYRCNFIICQWVLEKLCFIVWMIWTKWSWVQVQMVCLFVKKTDSLQWCSVGLRENKHAFIWDVWLKSYKRCQLLEDLCFSFIRQTFLIWLNCEFQLFTGLGGWQSSKPILVQKINFFFLW